ncbi:MAG: rhomboid family intramembrane serine protease [Pseudomonadota bacterium]
MFPIRDHNPSEKTPYVTYALLAANIGIFLSTLPLRADDDAIFYFYQAWGLVPAEFTSGNGLGNIFSSMFLHGGWMHLLGNMLFLWIFGDNMEEEFGHVGFLIFYLASGVAAGVAQVAVNPASLTPMVGASGAIAGVMGGYLLLFPRAKVDILFFFIIFFRIVPIPAWVMLGFWFVFQIVAGVADQAAGGGVAYWAHAGGFVAGFVFTLPLWMRLGSGSYWERTDGHPPHPEATYRFAKPGVPSVPRKPRNQPGPWGKK